MTNRLRRCKQCKEYAEAESGSITPAGFFHSIDCAMAYARERSQKAVARQLAKAKTDIKKKKKANSKAVRELDRKDVRWQHKLTQKAFNRMRVLQELKWYEDRGLEPECISCGKKNMDWCCGHNKTVGAHSELRYSEINTALQCNRYCNMGLSGNINGNKTTRGYRQGLIDRFGEEEAERINMTLNSISLVKWQWQQLEDMRALFNEAIGELEKEIG